MERLIEEKLIDQEVKKSGIKVSSKEIEATVEEVKRRNAVTQEDLEKALAADGLTLEAYKKQIEKRSPAQEVNQLVGEGRNEGRRKRVKGFLSKEYRSLSNQ